MIDEENVFLAIEILQGKIVKQGKRRIKYLGSDNLPRMNGILIIFIYETHEITTIKDLEGEKKINRYLKKKTRIIGQFAEEGFPQFLRYVSS